MTMKFFAKRWLLILALAAPSLAIACGVCIEDKIAATYDHAILTKAKAKNQIVVFGAIEGGNAAQAGARIATTASGIKGVQRGTTLTSAEPPAFSFVLDPRAQKPEAAIAELQRRIDMPGLRLALIRSMP
jgi:hypothetical protein